MSSVKPLGESKNRELSSESEDEVKSTPSEDRGSVDDEKEIGVSQEDLPDQEVIPLSEEGIESTTGDTTGDTTGAPDSGYKTGLIIGGVSFLCLAIGIFIAVMAGIRKKRGRKKSMRDDVTYEPYINSGLNDSSVKVLLDDSEGMVRIGRIHDVGKRSMQQDSFGISDLSDPDEIRKKGVMAVVADGMGGLSDGERMSQMVVVTMLRGFDESLPDAVPSSTLLGLVGEANDVVNGELGPERYGKCGSTVVAVIVRDNKLSWISVGDSHIYVYRAGKLVKLNKDHNYGTQLDEQVKNGEISFEEASTDPQRAALTSFIGIGDLELIDQNETPIGLESGDRILLMSDGVYGTVDERSLTELLALPFRKALSALERAVSARDKQNQDNYTCVIIEIK